MVRVVTTRDLAAQVAQAPTRRYKTAALAYGASTAGTATRPMTGAADVPNLTSAQRASRAAHRSDREDVSEQLVAVADARSTWAATLRDLAHLADREGVTAEVGHEAHVLARVLDSRAKRPTIPDATALAGAISAAERVATLDADWDAAVAAAREAERAHDLALHDLATARGEDA